MKEFLRYLFVVQHEYRDSTQATRARILLRLSSSIAVLGLIFGVYLVSMILLGIDGPVGVFMGGLIAPFFIGLPLLALWLTQRGSVNAAAVLMGGLLWLTVIVSLAIDGLIPGAVLTVPVALTFSGLAAGPRGAIVGMLAGLLLLLGTAYFQSEGMLQAEAQPFEDLLSEALVSASMLALTALLLGMFAWNLQNALLRANRIVAQTRATAEAGQILTRILTLDELMNQAVELLRDRFAFYQVQIFTVDEERTYANLVASTGEIGQALLAQGFRVPVTAQTVVGEVIGSGELRYIPDTHAASYQPIDLLAHTRAELTVPLAAGENVFGALDIQSLRPAAFNSEDIETLRVIANQIGQAIQTARLFEAQQRSLLQNRQLFLESETNLREIQRLNRQLTGQSWQEYVLERDVEQFGVQLIEHEWQPGPVNWTSAMQQATQRKRLVTHQDGNAQILSIPVSIRGEAIGAIEVELSGPRNQSEVRNILQAVTERMAFSLENARLFEQAQAAAEREQRINRISARLQGLTSVEDVLSTAISSLGEALEADTGSIRLFALDLDPTQGSPPGSTGQPVEPQNGQANQEQVP